MLFAIFFLFISGSSCCSLCSDQFTPPPVNHTNRFWNGSRWTFDLFAFYLDRFPRIQPSDKTEELGFQLDLWNYTQTTVDDFFWSYQESLDKVFPFLQFSRESIDQIYPDVLALKALYNSSTNHTVPYNWKDEVSKTNYYKAWNNLAIKADKFLKDVKFSLVKEMHSGFVNCEMSEPQFRGRYELSDSKCTDFIETRKNISDQIIHISKHIREKQNETCITQECRDDNQKDIAFWKEKLLELNEVELPQVNRHLRFCNRTVWSFRLSEFPLVETGFLTDYFNIYIATVEYFFEEGMKADGLIVDGPMSSSIMARINLQKLMNSVVEISPLVDQLLVEICYLKHRCIKKPGF